MLEITKICTKCKIEQPLSCFSKHVTSKGGRLSKCKNCEKDQRREYYIKNKSEINKRKKDFYIANREKILEQKQEYYITNKEKISLKDKARGKIYYSLNKDKVLARTNEYKLQNKAIILVKNKQYYSENKDIFEKYRIENKESIAVRMKEYTKQYYRTPKGRAVRVNSDHKRRSLEKQGDVTSEQLLMLTQSATHCFWCNLPLVNVKSHIDHLYPLSKGGKHTITNLVVSCAKCNMSKGAKDPIEFALKILSQNIVV